MEESIVDSSGVKPQAKYADLREFLSSLESHGDLKRIDTEVDPHLELTEISRRAREGKKKGTASLSRAVSSGGAPQVATKAPSKP